MPSHRRKHHSTSRPPSENAPSPGHSFPSPKARTVHCYATDITDRLNLEAQLRHSVKMEAVGQLAAGVAHDFNNILTIIQGHADLLPASPAAAARDRKIHPPDLPPPPSAPASSSSNCSCSAANRSCSSAIFDLNEIIAEPQPHAARPAGRTHRFEFEPAPDLPAICADAGMIEQVLVNLVLNARDAMPRGGRLTLSTSPQVLEPVAAVLNPEARPGTFRLPERGRHRLRHGRTDHLEPSFEPFFTTKEAGKGTGLGLATVYGIVKQHQGWIDGGKPARAPARRSPSFFPRRAPAEAARPSPPPKPARQPARHATRRRNHPGRRGRTGLARAGGATSWNCAATAFTRRAPAWKPCRSGQSTRTR